MNNNSLQHHGVKGMKWGIRRTPAQLGHKAKKKKITADQRAKANMRKDVKNRRLLSDDEIKKKIERIQNQKKLKELTEEELSPGRKAAKRILSNSGQKVATTLITGAALYGVKSAMTRHFDVREAASYMTPKPKNK